MQKHVNVMLLLVCPHCLAELATTIDDYQQEATLRCSRCGARTDLHPEDLPTAGVRAASDADHVVFSARF